MRHQVVVEADQMGAHTRATSEPSELDTSGSLAIFDLDRTLHAGSGLGVLAQLAFRRRLIGPGRAVRSLLHDVVFRKLGSTDDQISSIAELALEMAAGVRSEDLAPVVDAAAQQIAESVRPPMQLLLDNHLQAGHFCVLLSASPQPLVEQVATLLGAHRGIGTVIETDDAGVLTGRIVQPMCYGEGKLDRLDAAIGWSPETGSSTFTYAYADSMSDLPLLEAVNSPVVIVPDKPLRRLAAERDWPVIDF
ncbi:MAG: HAD-IB family hydrolase [Actinomycetota bacterium]